VTYAHAAPHELRDAGAFRRTSRSSSYPNSLAARGEGGRPSDPTSSVLDAETRKRWDREAQGYVEQEGGSVEGLLDWLNPLGISSRLTEGDVALNRAQRPARQGLRRTEPHPDGQTRLDRHRQALTGRRLPLTL
jgi:hypothetical protein